MSVSSSTLWTIGKLAKLINVSVRTLRHYHKLGLLLPHARTNARYRLYNVADLERLQLIRSLQTIGLSLAEIKAVIEQKKPSLTSVLQWQVSRLKTSLQRQKQLHDYLEQAITKLGQESQLTPETFINLIQLMNYPQPQFSDEEMAKIKAQGQKVGQGRIKEVEQEWPILIAAVQKAMDQDLDPQSDDVKKLAQKWQSLVKEFTGGDPGITAKLKTAYQNHQGFTGGPTPAMMEYIGKALNA